MVDLSLHILDVATNAFKAKATLVKIIIEEKEEFIQVSIEDDGCGMSDEVLQQVTNPFFTSRTTRNNIEISTCLFASLLKKRNSKPYFSRRSRCEKRIGYLL